MGNEQAAPLQQSQQNGQDTRKFVSAHEVLIVVRGQRYTGKSLLIKRMKGGDFTDDYEPTPELQASQIIWNSPPPDPEPISLKVWDLVEKALLPADASEVFDLPDATTINSNKSADGLIILIDKRHSDTVSLAESIISAAPVELPILLFSNFHDDESISPVIPESLHHLISRFLFVPGSLKTGQGLEEVRKWLQIPLKASKRRLYLSHFKAADADLKSLIAEAAETTSHFIDEGSARHFMPKPLSPPKVPEVTKVTEVAKVTKTEKVTGAEKVTKAEKVTGERKSEEIEKRPKATPLEPKEASKMPNKTQTEQKNPSQNDSAKEDFWSESDDEPLVLEQPTEEEDAAKPNPLVKGRNASPKKPEVAAREEEEDSAEESEENSDQDLKEKIKQIGVLADNSREMESFFSDDDNEEEHQIDIDDVVISNLPKISIQPSLNPVIVPVPIPPPPVVVEEPRTEEQSHKIEEPKKKVKKVKKGKKKSRRRRSTVAEEAVLPPEGDYEVV